MDYVIELKQVSKFFYDESSSSKSLKQRLSTLFFKKDKSSPVTYDVLKDVTLKVIKGEFLGIMGRNGAGKSTILKIIAGIYHPNSGTVESRGKIVPLLELGAGFVEELSGYENIILNAAIMGFSRSEAELKVKRIIEFSELGSKINAPVRTYSSGMMVRLGFSIAAHLDADILLFDEILAVGDAGFQTKCLKKVSELFHAGKTIILVTHTPELISTHCSRCILVDNAQVVFDGPASIGARKYEQLFS